MAVGFNSNGGDCNDAMVSTYRVAHVGAVSELANGTGNTAGKGRYRQRAQLNGLTG